MNISQIEYASNYGLHTSSFYGKWRSVFRYCEERIVTGSEIGAVLCTYWRVRKGIARNVVIFLHVSYIGRSRKIIITIVTKLQAGRTGVRFFAGSRGFLFWIWCLPNFIFDGDCGENRPRGDVDYIPASIVKIKNTWNYNSTPILILHGVYRNYFIFILAVMTVSRFAVVGPNFI